MLILFEVIVNTSPGSIFNQLTKKGYIYELNILPPQEVNFETGYLFNMSS